MKNLNILFLGGAKRIGVAESFIKEGKSLGYNVNIFSYELSYDVPISIIGTVILGLKWNEEKLYQHLVDTIVNNSIQIIIPFLDPATIVASKLKDVCEDNKLEVFIPVSDTNECKLFFNKLEAEQWCLKNNISYPKSKGDFPLFAKPVEGFASKGTKLITKEEDLIGITGNENYIIQKYIDGDEYSIDIYRSTREKKIIVIVPRIRLETQGGEVIKSMTVKDTRIIEFTTNLLNYTELVGPLTLQILKEKSTGRIYFMELNPRFGGGVVTAIGAGANIPKMVLSDYKGIKINEVCDWKDGLLMLRYFKETYKNANNN